MKSVSILCFVSLMLWSCAADRTQSQNHRQPDQLKETAISKSHKHGEFMRDSLRFKTVTNPRPIDVESYDLRGQFDWMQKRMTAQVSISFRALSELETLVLDSAVHKVLKVTDSVGTSLEFNVDDEQETIEIKLGSKLNPDTLGSVTITYEVFSRGTMLSSGDASESGLVAVPHRMGDPIQARVLFTFSEPLGAMSWMPCHNVPTDRALFKSHFELSKQEMFISNGVHLSDESVTESTHRVSYSTKDPIPTYLMAFAAGDLEETKISHGQLPVSVVARRGLAIDASGLLNETVRQLKLFEKLLGAYPFEKYALVLLPEFSGGMEHASITFNNEERSSQSRIASDVSLMAHELAHHWFGDAVTVETWDDLWIKEGMATLLAEEGTRKYTDFSGDRLLGSELWIANGEAVRDPNLKPDDKYTNGPYGRSAWLLTQIRYEIGERAFWKVMRKVMQAHMFGSIGTETFLSYFDLSPDLMARVRSALHAHQLPVLKLEEKAGAMQLTLDDPQGSLVAPLKWKWRRGAMTQVDGVLRNKGDSVIVNLDAPGYFYSDPDDIHPDWIRFAHIPDATPETNAQNKELHQKLIIKRASGVTNDEIAALAFTHSGQQLRALQAALEVWDPKALSTLTFDGLWQNANSHRVHYELARVACSLAKRSEGLTREQWFERAVDGLRAWNIMGVGYSDALTECAEVLPAATFLDEETLMVQNPKSVHLSEDRIFYLSRIEHPSLRVFQLWRKISLEGASMRIRNIAIQKLVNEVTSKSASMTENEKNLYTAQLSILLKNTRAGVAIRSLLSGFLSLKFIHAMGLLPAVVMDPYVRMDARTASICAAHTLSQMDTSQDHWNGFKKSLDMNQVPNVLKGFLETPEKCAKPIHSEDE